MLRGQALGDQRAVAGLGVALDAEQRRRDGRRLELDTVENLCRVAPRVFRCEPIA
jgi:hypothetical protein